jgi:hypothetical protein
VSFGATRRRAAAGSLIALQRRNGTLTDQLADRRRRYWQPILLCGATFKIDWRA